jgi:plastocyanin
MPESRRGRAWSITALLWIAAGSAPAWGQGVSVSGKISVAEKDRLAEDVGQAVVWLEGRNAEPAAPGMGNMSTEGKQFLPHIVVITAGSTITFPNHDPFNHNVFSLSEPGAFDLGLYGRGDGKSQQFDKAGVIRVYCNVHATMSGFIVVRDNPYFAQPGADGSFTIENVPPGAYTLHAWHERAKDYEQPLGVPATGVKGLALELDARGYKFKSHLNKYGQPYTTQGRRY